MCTKNCCCIFSPKTGTLMLIWTTVIIWSIGLVTATYEFVTCIGYEESSSEEHFDLDDMAMKTMNSIGKSNIGASSFFVLFSINIFVLAVAISALYAIDKKKPILLIPYFMYRMFWLIALLLALIPVMFFETFFAFELDEIPGMFGYALGMYGNIQSYLGIIISWFSKIIWLLVILQFIMILIEFNFTRAVYSCYQIVEKEKALKNSENMTNASWNATNNNRIYLHDMQRII